MAKSEETRSIECTFEPLPQKPKKKWFQRDWELRAIQENGYDTRCMWICKLTGRHKVKLITGAWTIEQLKGIKP